MKKLALGFAFVVGGSAVSLTQVSAVAVNAKPTKPVVSVISAKTRGIKGKVDVTVVFESASTNSKSPLQFTEVRVGNYMCRSLLKSTRCTVKNVPTTRTLKVDARAKNKNGFGPRSSSVSYRPASGKVWRKVSPEPPSTTIVTSPSGITSTSLKFDIAGAIGLSLKSSVSTAGVRKLAAGSNLQAIGTSGVMKDALVSGSATISRFLIAPNDKLYVVFSSKPTINGGPCVLAEIDRNTGDPTCIESDQGFQFVPPGQFKQKFTTGTGGFRNLLNDFQFDNNGAIYYWGTPGTKDKYPGLNCCSAYSGNTPSFGAVVRKYLNGTRTEFGISYFEPGKTVESGFTDSMANQLMLRRGVLNFLVLPDGKVIIDQSLDYLKTSDATYCPFERLDLWAPDGTRRAISGLPNFRWGAELSATCRTALESSDLRNEQELRYGEAYSFLRMFGSSDVVVGGNGRVFRVDVASATATELPFSRSTWCTASGGVPNYLFDFSHYFCSDGTMWRGTWRTPTGDFYAIVGQDPAWRSFSGDARAIQVGSEYGSGVLVKMWPTLAVTSIGYDLPSAVLTRVESFLPIMGSLVASGTTVSGAVQTVLYDTLNGNSEVLIPASSGLRPRKFAFNAGANRVLFSTSNSVGMVNLATKQVTLISESSGPDDIQAFAS